MDIWFSVLLSANPPSSPGLPKVRDIVDPLYAPRRNEGEYTEIQIVGNDVVAGSDPFKSFNLNVKANIVRVERSSGEAPDFRILAGNVSSAPDGRSGSRD
ncbi:DUF736 domain-containing protein (plasmid) [Neorhizobium galegae]|nr:DUF736 domain-containing protein [Neorhizobium galegae]